MSSAVYESQSEALSLLDALSDQFVRIVERVSPAVVNVRTGRGGGSGVVITPDGYVLTNAHVVGEAQRVELRQRDGADIAADVVGTDPSTDLAVLRARNASRSRAKRSSASAAPSRGARVSATIPSSSRHSRSR